MTMCVSNASAQIRVGGKKLDTQKLLGAAKDVATAITLSDEDIARLSRESVEWMDANNPIADETTEYGARLKRLTENITEVNDLKLNFKVYHVVDVNAFACGDGSIRVFSALMDLMDDDELMAIIGHEIGHVVHADVKHAMKNAYLASAARGVVGSTGGAAAKLTDSQLGDVVQAFTSAQFSQNRSTRPTNMACSSVSNRGSIHTAWPARLKSLWHCPMAPRPLPYRRCFPAIPTATSALPV